MRLQLTQTAHRPPSPPISTRYLWLAALLMLLCSSLAQAENQWLRYRIPGMNCPGCSAQLRSELLKVPGVKQVQVQRSKEEIKVIYDDELADVLDIETAIATVGFVGTLSAQSR